MSSEGWRADINMHYVLCFPVKSKWRPILEDCSENGTRRKRWPLKSERGKIRKMYLRAWQVWQNFSAVKHAHIFLNQHFLFCSLKLTLYWHCNKINLISSIDLFHSTHSRSLLAPNILEPVKTVMNIFLIFLLSASPFSFNRKRCYFHIDLSFYINWW